MLTIDVQTCACFDVDPQRGFSPLCPGELPVPGGDEIVDELNRQARFCARRLVSKDCHPAAAPWVAGSPAEVLQPVAGDYPELDVKWPSHCVIGTDGNRLLPGLPEEKDYDLVIEKGSDPLKHPYGACYHDLHEKESTGAIEWLREAGITTLVVGGLATDYCVKTTVLQLLRAGFRVLVNRAACRGISPATTRTALDEMAERGAIIIDSSAELTSG
jgi:nicotinamidase/pyrazinamidase